VGEKYMELILEDEDADSILIEQELKKRVIERVNFS
jgi:hypothetical protein